MKTIHRFRCIPHLMLALSLLLLPTLSRAAGMYDYCVVPPFIGENVPANLLLMIDNSSSMYDLSYSDQGQPGRCSTTTSTVCTSSAGCPSGETCSKGTCSTAPATVCSTDAGCTGGTGPCIKARNPYSCIDETYRSTTVYAGYFDHATYYVFNFGSNYFETGSFDATRCTLGGIANTLCVGIDGSSNLNYLGASGNYLNWLTASKFDVEKQVLTGGKDVSKLCTGTDKACTVNGDCASGTCDAVATTFLQAESRGCLGQGFVKIALTGDFVNFASGVTDPNTQKGVVFLVKGPTDSTNPSAPSRGGQTYIEIYNSTGTTFNNLACQQAIDAWATVDKQGMSDATQTCIGYNSGQHQDNFCSALQTRLCPNNTAAECQVTTAAVPGKCNDPAATACTADSNCHAPVTNPGTCSGGTNNGQPCTTDAFCGTTTVPGTCNNDSGTKTGNTCGGAADCVQAGACNNLSGTKTGVACTTDPATCVQMGVCDNATGAKKNAACTTSNPDCLALGACDASSGTQTGVACTASTTCVQMGTCAAGTTPIGGCTASANCPVAEHMGNCSIDIGTPCKVNSTCSRNYCDKNTPRTCTTVGGNCNAGDGKCAAQTCVGYVAAYNAACNNYLAGSCLNYLAGTCANYHAGSCVGYLAGTCSGASTVQNYCVGITTTTYTCGSPPPTPASTVDYGPCINPTQSAVVKTKTAYTHTINTCSAYLSNGNMTNGDVSTFTNSGDCTTVYAGWGICSNDNTVVCTVDGDCGGNTCTHGPASILPGNAALICGLTYLGAYYTGTPPNPPTGTWDKSAWSSDTAGMMAAFKSYCNATQPTVIDPSGVGSTNNYEQTPAILSGMGVEGQLGSPIGRVPVRNKIAVIACVDSSTCPVNTTCSNGACVPSGLIQTFGNRIRIGAMSFDFNGSATEAGAVGSPIITPKVCSNDATRLCAMPADCIAPGTCAAAVAGSTNLDGGRIIYPIGLGVCATMGSSTCTTDANCGGDSCINGVCGVKHSSTVCTTDTNCASGDTCISNGPGGHTTGLINTLDSIRANAWTPFAEAFFNAIGYFARTASGTSRTDLRINTIDATSTDFTILANAPKDFNENLNPSQYKCQQNYLLLITDGTSTADQQSSGSGPSMAGLAAKYGAVAGITPQTCDFAGSTYLPIMSWIGHNLNIATFSTSTVSTTAPVLGRDKITTYVVSTGGSNGAAGECNSSKLLADTATKGGTSLYQASNPDELKDALTTVFQSLAAASASGTAASILSNSEGTGANILQAIFFPRKIFENDTQSNWLGELNNLWYYVDPKINNSSVREDTVTDYRLGLKSDYDVTFRFKPADNTVYVKLLVDSNGDGSGDSNPSVSDSRLITPSPFADSSVWIKADDLKGLWKAGKQLWSRDLTSSPRTIYTPCITGGTCVSGTGLMKFNFGTYPPTGTPGSVTLTPDNSSFLQAALQYPAAADQPTAQKLMKFVHGFDYPGDKTIRSRTVKIGSIPAATVSIDPAALYVTNPRDKGIGVWKLGDIVSSTPRVQSSIRQNNYALPAPSGYSDTSYGSDSASTGYTSTSAYKNRGIVYAGANDGMLHAFKLGTLNVNPAADIKATLINPDATTGQLGTELWAFMPQNVLPYLKYYADPNYGHLYYVDGNTTIVDASVAKPTGCSETFYWDCVKDKTSGNGTNWRTILVGGMGIGGASRNLGDLCTDNVGGTCVKSPVDGVGYSSYYALDVTDPLNPVYLWEFSDAAIDSGDRGLGFATSGAAVVKISARTIGADSVSRPDISKNGRWFAVFGSGPTGPIDKSSNRFMGTSNQQLQLYVVDLYATPPFVKGTNYWVISDVYDGGTNSSATIATATKTTLPNAFAGNLTAAPIDIDRWNSASLGFYQDNALYFGYTQKHGAAGPWIDGGVLKLVTNEDPDPSAWRLVKVFDGTGPITTSIARLQDRKNGFLWLYFGSGRYYYLKDDFDTNPREKIFGIKEPCYIGNSNILDSACAVKHTMGDETNQNLAANATVNSVGWSIQLDGTTVDPNDANDTLGGERLITDPVALTNGAVFFTTYQPNNDFCQFGGSSYIWGVKYDTGNQAPAVATQGKILIQLSTGEFQSADLTFPDKQNRRSGAMTGKPPNDPPPIISKSNNKPVKRILHMQER